MLMIAALAIGVTACSDDNEGDDPKGPATTNFNVRARGGNVLVTLATSDYAIDIPADAAAWVGQSEQSEGGVVVLTVEPNATGAERQTTVTLSAKTTLETLAYMKIKQSGESDVDSGDFVIEEIFYTSNTLPETGEPDMWYGDQYIKIRNNTDHDLYADGMLIIGSMLNSGQNFSFYEGEDFHGRYLLHSGQRKRCLGQGRSFARDLQQRPKPQGEQSQLVRPDDSRFRMVQRIDQRELPRYR